MNTLTDYLVGLLQSAPAPDACWHPRPRPTGIYNVHRHPEFWQNPTRFEPERFSPERGASHHGSAYMPFGAGQHKCIGNNLALMEGPLLLAMIAQRYELDLAPGCSVEREVAVTMRPKKGLYVSLRPR